MKTSPSRLTVHDRGFVLPLVLLGLVTILMLALAGYDAARFGLAAARNQAAATAALHAADSGLELYLQGAGPAAGPLPIAAPPGSAVVRVTPLVSLGDSDVLIHVVSEGRAPEGTERPVVRRTAVVARIDDAGLRHRVHGSWRERF